MAEEITVWWATEIEKQILNHRMRIEKLEKNPIIRGHKHDEVGRIVWVVGDGPFPEKSKPHTCGECDMAWHKNGSWSLLCFDTDDGRKSRYVGSGRWACKKFKPRGESCTE